MKKVYFDVGANDGHSSIPKAQGSDLQFYAFEPTPQMIEKIKTKIVNVNNYTLVEKAVSDFNGYTTFNVSVGDFGCSSLLEFSEKNKTEWGPERRNLADPIKIEVEVIRLDKFVVDNDIEEITFLHIDTQGSDLNVLKGLGDRISIVKEGVMEAAIKQDVLYRGQNMKDECVAWLESNGFSITRFESNDLHGNEINIYFKNNNINEH